MPARLEQPAKSESAQIAKGTEESEWKRQRVRVNHKKFDSLLCSLLSSPRLPLPMALKHHLARARDLCRCCSQVEATAGLIC